MKFIKILPLLLLIFCGNINISQGVLFNDKLYSDIPDFETESLGFTVRNNFPAIKSLRVYAPSVQMQNGNSCTGFAVAYSALSIMHNYKLGIKKEFQKKFTAFDPYFLYSISHDKKDDLKDCNDATIMSFAFYNLKNFGCKKYWMTPFLDCNKKAKSKYFSVSNPYRIKNYTKFNADILNDEKKIRNSIKEAINSGKPVVVGLKYTNSMAGKGFEDGTVGKDGLWEPIYYDKKNGGHAVTVVGYSNYKFGGSYEIMNSWGKKYGENGFMWIKYNDLIDVITRAYVMEIKENNLNYSNKDSYCSIGNSIDGYLQIVKKNNYGEFTFSDCLYSNGMINGNLIAITPEWAMVIRVKNNKRIGLGYFYNSKNKKLYSIKYRDDQLIRKDYLELLGFSPDQKNLEDLELKEYVAKIYQGKIKPISELSETEYKNITNEINLFFKSQINNSF